MYTLKQANVILNDWRRGTKLINRKEVDFNHRIFKIILFSFSFAVPFVVATSTSFYNDDFFWLNWVQGRDTLSKEWFGPMFGHLITGVLIIFKFISFFGEYSRLTFAFISGILNLVICFITWQLIQARRFHKNEKLSLIFVIISSFLLPNAINFTYASINLGILPMTALILCSILLLVHGVKNHSRVLLLVSALTFVTSLFFFETAFTFIPFLGLLSAYFLNLENELNFRKRLFFNLGGVFSRTINLWYKIPLVLLIGVYLSIRTRPIFLEQFTHPTAFELFISLPKWLFYQTIPFLAGGPIMKEPCSPGCYLLNSSLDRSLSDFYVPLALGISFIILVLWNSKSKTLFYVFFSVSILQAGIILWARLESVSDLVFTVNLYLTSLLPISLLFMSTALLELTIFAKTMLQKISVFILIAFIVGLNGANFTAYFSSYKSNLVNEWFSNYSLSQSSFDPNSVLLDSGLTLGMRFGIVPSVNNTSLQILDTKENIPARKVTSQFPKFYRIMEDGMVKSVSNQNIREYFYQGKSCDELTLETSLINSSGRQNSVIMNLFSSKTQSVKLEIGWDEIEVILNEGENYLVFQTFGITSPIKISTTDNGEVGICKAVAFDVLDLKE